MKGRYKVRLALIIEIEREKIKVFSHQPISELTDAARLGLLEFIDQLGSRY